MGKLREFWCWLAKWTFWPAVRGWIIAALISTLIAGIAGLLYVVRGWFGLNGPVPSGAWDRNRKFGSAES